VHVTASARYPIDAQLVAASAVSVRSGVFTIIPPSLDSRRSTS
jgi:hypothetical protein